MFRSAAVAILCAVPFVALRAQLLQPGEELEYKVSYLGITLGFIRIITEEPTSVGEAPAIRVRATMQSNPDIPFLSLRAVFESLLDTSAAFSYRFRSQVQQGDEPQATASYEFDYARRQATMQEWRNGELLLQRRVRIRSRLNDGLSLLFAARRYVLSGKSYRFPTVVNSDTFATVIHFTQRREAVRIDAVPYPVRTVYFRGNSNWTGIYGLTGAFEGWFSDDDARVPIRARMRVYVGNVLIELVRWKRNGWMPPAAELPSAEP
jgi:hypothetical protein